ncbi:hypothetical protein GCM10011571_17320 [Marinithermofilum abyssi]|uniref:Uncharacterized protein n=1 Tax=Marinithermofilum abyssi TaxID=1571185 RepID=A0A8J2VF69_9BACL|nr:hypothetical protein GCM10011571_17320 [Marinithermofilum abyssi]
MVLGLVMTGWGWHDLHQQQSLGRVYQPQDKPERPLVVKVPPPMEEADDVVYKSIPKKGGIQWI